ncbi:hypothetical protein [Mesonia sp. HuA40]|uniref:hypothetical protein n=1 Tax=Mesonia sp. HuA40 TaxID=2602761 RepID=UPI0011C84C81|nr:hypothetical protein [Mesonia sp. HuA40]TXK71163.1 hypothetical protein FT993_11380 [Mesonia sp. HuA40]
MKINYFIYLLASLIIMSCSGLKKTEKALNSGNYEQAIYIATSKLQRNKEKKSNEAYIKLLEQAHKKFVQEKEARLKFLEKDRLGNHKEEIYDSYAQLNAIQNKIKALTPLYFQNGKTAKFYFKDYTNDIIKAKNEYIANLYRQSEELLNERPKESARLAFEKLQLINQLAPNYKNTIELLNQAHIKGTDFIYLSVENHSDKVIPKALEKDILNFSGYDLDNFWQSYHAYINPEINYDYGIHLDFKTIEVSPEKLNEREEVIQKEITIHKGYQKDRNGNYILDDEGNKIELNQTRNVKAKLLTTNQFKAIYVKGRVDYLDTQTNQVIQSFPLDTEFIFENIFTRFNGDKRALSKEQLALTQNNFVGFPTSEQMLFDAATNIKERLASIIRQNRFN